MTTAEERIQRCTLYQSTVDDLKNTVYDKKDGLVMKAERQGTKLAIFITMQSITMVAIVSASIKIIFFGI